MNFSDYRDESRILLLERVLLTHSHPEVVHHFKVLVADVLPGFCAVSGTDTVPGTDAVSGAAAVPGTDAVSGGTEEVERMNELRLENAFADIYSFLMCAIEIVKMHLAIREEGRKKVSVGVGAGIVCVCVS